jgi:hypothetical protein
MSSPTSSASSSSSDSQTRPPKSERGHSWRRSLSSRRSCTRTLTRGIRVQPEARPAGEGRYAIADHAGHTHLAYVLEFGIELDAERAAVENADLFRQLRLRPGELPTEPLEKGRVA